MKWDKDKKVPKDAPTECFNKYTQLYVQAQCDPTDDEIVFAKQTSVMTIFLGMIMSLIFTGSINYLEHIQVFLYKKWDITTATPADFTIKLNISDSQYSNYQESLKNGEHSKPMNELIIEALETKVNSLDKIFED